MPSKYHQLKRWRSSATRPYVVLVPYVSFPVWTVVQTFHDLKKKSKRKKEFYQQQLLQEKAVLTQQLDNANTLLEQAEKDKSTLKLDYEKLRTEVAFNEAYITKILEEKTQVEEKKQIITEDYEKLKLKVASDTEEQYINDVQNLKTEVSEKDKVIAKLTSKVEEQLQNEKQIITDLRAKVSDNELYTTKLMKEKSQLQERVTSLEEQSIKETRKQFNLKERQKENSKQDPPFPRFLILIYLLFISFVLTANYNSKQFIAPLPGVEIDASINQLVAGGSHTQLHWEEYGLTLEVPPDALPCGFIAEIAAYVSNSGPYYAASSNTWPTSTTVYWISSSKDFVTPVSLKIQLSHAVRQNVSSEIKVLMTDVRATQNVPYVFEDYSNFIVNGPYVYMHLSLNQFIGISVTSVAKHGFQGILFKSLKANNVWEYSFVVFKSSVNDKLFAEYAHWIKETEIMAVSFEGYNEAIILDLPSSLKYWNVTTKSTLVYYKDELLSQNFIQSNMQFTLSWKGHEYEKENVTLHFSGMEPAKVRFYTSSIKDDDKNHGVHVAPLPGVEIDASTKQLAAGGAHTQLHWEEYGLTLDVLPDALPPGFIAEITAYVSNSGPYYAVGSNTWPTSTAVYWISSSNNFVIPVSLKIQLSHAVRENVSSEIKVLMADVRATQNAPYVFEDYSNFIVNGPYVYMHLSLNQFIGISVTSIAKHGFQGILFKSLKANNVWEYSFVMYKSSVNDKLFAEYSHWIKETEIMAVSFEGYNEAVILDLPSSLKYWNVTTKSTLVYYKDELLSQNFIESNMQFTLSWKGHEYEKENVTLHFSGMEPAKVTFYTSSIKDDGKNYGVHVEKQLDVTNLDQVVLLLTNNYYDISDWERLCLSLGLYKHTLNAIRIENKNDVLSSLIECLYKWLLRIDKVDDKGGPTLTSLKNALRENGQKAVAENIMKF